jgi:hypothetical protein
MLILERLHKEALQKAARVYANKKRVHETRLVPVYQHRIVHMQREEAYQALTAE